MSSAAASPTPSSKSNATDTLVARFRDVDSEVDSEKASEGKVADSDEDGVSEDSDDSQEEEGKRMISPDTLVSSHHLTFHGPISGNNGPVCYEKHTCHFPMLL